MVNVVDLIAGVMPWAGGLVPATMTYRNVQENLGYSPVEALIVAAVVEGIGFVAVTTALDMYELHQAKKASSWDAQELDGQFWVAVSVSILYLVAVLSVNALLDGGDGLHRVTNGLLSIFGVMGGILVALRNQLGKQRDALASNRLAAETEAQRIADEMKARSDEEIAYQRKLHEEEISYQRKLHEDKLQLEHETELAKIEAESRRKLAKIEAEGNRKASAETPEDTGEQRIVTGKQAEGIRRWPDVPESDWEWLSKAPASEIVTKYSIRGKDPERMARTWRKYATEALGDIKTKDGGTA